MHSSVIIHSDCGSGRSPLAAVAGSRFHRQASNGTSCIGWRETYLGLQERTLFEPPLRPLPLLGAAKTRSRSKTEQRQLNGRAYSRSQQLCLRLKHQLKPRAKLYGFISSVPKQEVLLVRRIVRVVIGRKLRKLIYLLV